MFERIIYRLSARTGRDRTPTVPESDFPPARDRNLIPRNGLVFLAKDESPLERQAREAKEKGDKERADMLALAAKRKAELDAEAAALAEKRRKEDEKKERDARQAAKDDKRRI